ncbi:MAG: hypothetical protein KDK23_04760 [Leptospiraceae bacterium]|nr:hypothetical protein [Leptospiraceae bacterium]
MEPKDKSHTNPRVASILFAFFFLYSVGCSGLKQPASGDGDLISLGFLLEPAGDCAFGREQAANDFRAEVFPMPAAGCNARFYHGNTYQDYVNRERRYLQKAQEFLQINAPSDCAARITAFQGFIDAPATYPLILDTATLSASPSYTVVDGKVETRNTIIATLTAQGLSAQDAAIIADNTYVPSYTEHVESYPIVLAVLLTDQAMDNVCLNAVKQQAHARVPDWIADEKMDTVTQASLSTSTVLRLFLGKCFFGTANDGNPIKCATL